MRPVDDAEFLFVPEHLIGRTLGERYRVDEVLATGGMGLVCVGTDMRTSRSVAIKLLKPQTGTDARSVKRFLREVELAARLRHPHIVDVLDLGTLAEGKAPYLVMELLSGRSLEAELAERGRLDAQETLEILLPVMSALASVHEAGVVHRDVKPGNIFLHRDAFDRRMPKLLDFGIAKAEGSGSETSTGGLVGTPAYMAPEQLVDGTIGPSTDVWAMGAVMYRCLSGGAPLSGGTPAQTLAKIATETAPPLVVAGLHRAFCAAIDRALLRNPSHRYADMNAFFAAMVSAAHAANLDVAVPSIGSFEPHDAVDADADRTRDMGVAPEEATPLELSVHSAGRATHSQPEASARSPRPGRRRAGTLAVASALAVVVAASFGLRRTPELVESGPAVAADEPERPTHLGRFVPKVAAGHAAPESAGEGIARAVARVEDGQPAPMKKPLVPPKPALAVERERSDRTELPVAVEW